MNISLPFETRRMRLRLLDTSDIDAVHRQFSDPEMCRYFSEPPVSREEARGIIDHYRDPEGKDHLRYGMFAKDSGEFIGTCGYHYWDKQIRQVEIGYDIWKDYWRQGYVSEALSVLIDICFTHLGVDWVYVLIDPENSASLATARKLGFGECPPCRRPDDETSLGLKLSRAAWLAHASQATPFADVNALLLRLLTDITDALKDRFVAMYLHGSLAGGDFDPRRSDIDFVVVTEGGLPSDALTALHDLHHRIATSDLAWATNFEGSYIPRQAIRRQDPTDCIFPAVQVDGGFSPARHGGEWVIQRHIIRERGVRLMGPDPATFIDPVTPDELRQAQRDLLEAWWALKVDDPQYLRDSEYQAYAVLTMCRALYTLEYGEVATKPAAAAWAREMLDGCWAGLIERAVSWRHGIVMSELDEVQAFIRFALGRARSS